MRKVSFVIILAALMLVAACGPSVRNRISDVLDDVEGYINERPDSALAVLEGVDSTALGTRSLRARYALLHVMALDKCYADITAPGLLDPAVAWYEHHGTPDDRMKVLYYRGRIAQDTKDQNGAAVFYAMAEEFADDVTDQHALALLYMAEASVFNTVYNVDQEEFYAQKALEVFKRSDDPMQGAAIGELALVSHSRREWSKADSLYREAIARTDSYQHTQALLLSNYARMKVLQPNKDPEGTIELLNRKRAFTGGRLTPQEAGVYAYATGMQGEVKILSQLQGMSGDNRKQTLIWLYRIALRHNSTEEALQLLQEARYQEDERINGILSNSVSSALQNYNRKKVEYEHNRRWREVSTLAIILLFSTVIAVMAIYHRRQIEVERDGLLRISSSLEKEMKEAQEQNKQQLIQLRERTERLSEEERKLNQLKEEYNLERMARFRQAGSIGSVILMKEKNWISEAAAWRLLRRDIIYIHHLEKNGAELIRRMDQELDGVISRLRRDLHLIGKPQDVLFLCCCILDIDAQVLADLTGKKTLDAVYKKRSRL